MAAPMHASEISVHHRQPRPASAGPCHVVCTGRRHEAGSCCLLTGTEMKCLADVEAPTASHSHRLSRPLARCLGVRLMHTHACACAAVQPCRCHCCWVSVSRGSRSRARRRFDGSAVGWLVGWRTDGAAASLSVLRPWFRSRNGRRTGYFFEGFFFWSCVNVTVGPN